MTWGLFVSGVILFWDYFPLPWSFVCRLFRFFSYFLHWLLLFLSLRALCFLQNVSGEQRLATTDPPRTLPPTRPNGRDLGGTVPVPRLISGDLQRALPQMEQNFSTWCKVNVHNRSRSNSKPNNKEPIIINHNYQKNTLAYKPSPSKIFP